MWEISREFFNGEYSSYVYSRMYSRGESGLKKIHINVGPIFDGNGTEDVRN